MEEQRQAQLDYAAGHWGGNRGAPTFGSRLADSAYEACLAYERRQRGYKVERQKPLPVVYTDVKFDCGVRLDLVVEAEDKVMVEVKAIERRAPIRDAQLLSYLRVSSKSVGLIINFPARLLKNGLKRIELSDSGRAAVSKKAENSPDI